MSGNTEERCPYCGAVIDQKREAQKWLEMARGNYRRVAVVFEIEKCRKILEKANLSIEDIGTSENELERLLITGYLSVAKRWLERARKTFKRVGSSISAKEVGHCRWYLKEAGGFEPVAIGTSEDELKRLEGKFV